MLLGLHQCRIHGRFKGVYKGHVGVYSLYRGYMGISSDMMFAEAIWGYIVFTGAI